MSSELAGPAPGWALRRIAAGTALAAAALAGAWWHPPRAVAVAVLSGDAGAIRQLAGRAGHC